MKPIEIIHIRILKTYLVFAGTTYYSAGGWGDFCFSFQSNSDMHLIPKEAEFLLVQKEDRCDFAHVVDVASLEKVYEFSSVEMERIVEMKRHVPKPEEWVATNHGWRKV